MRYWFSWTEDVDYYKEPGEVEVEHIDPVMSQVMRTFMNQPNVKEVMVSLTGKAEGYSTITFAGVVNEYLDTALEVFHLAVDVTFQESELNSRGGKVSIEIKEMDPEEKE